MTGVLPGDRQGIERTVTWSEPGRLTGDDTALLLFRLEADRWDGFELGIVGTGGTRTAADHLRDGISVQFIAVKVFGTVVYGGDLPVPPKVPTGAQA